MDRLVTGFIRSPHGLNGFVKVQSASGEFSHFEGLAEITIRTGGKDGTERRLEIEEIDGLPFSLMMKFKGIDTAEQAKTLAGAEILVSRDKACPLEKGEYYVVDLCTCKLVYDGVPIGQITGVMEGGADDLLEVTLSECSGPDSSGNRSVLVPFRKEFVGKVDIKAGTVELMHRWIIE